MIGIKGSRRPTSNIDVVIISNQNRIVLCDTVDSNNIIVDRIVINDVVISSLTVLDITLTTPKRIPCHRRTNDSHRQCQNVL